MNIQQYFEEREQKEREKSGRQPTEPQATMLQEMNGATVIPVVLEQARIDTVQTDSAKIKIRKTVSEVEKNVDVPLMKEGYHIEKVPVNAFVDSAPAVREEADTIIVPVVQEVLWWKSASSWWKKCASPNTKLPWIVRKTLRSGKKK